MAETKPSWLVPAGIWTLKICLWKLKMLQIFCKVFAVSYRVKHTFPCDLANSLLDLYQDKCKYYMQLVCNIYIAHIITLHILLHWIYYYFAKCKYCIQFAYKLNIIYVQMFMAAFFRIAKHQKQFKYLQLMNG